METLIETVRDRSVQLGIWLMIIPGLMFGTLNVLSPLRLDALGAGAVAIAASFLSASAFEAVVAPVVGRISDRRGRRAPAIAGLALSAVVMALLPWPDVAWQLGLLIVLAAPAIGILWSPAIATMSDGAERHGIEQAIAFAFVNVAWALGQTAGAAGSARLADATSDRVPFLLLAGIGAATALALRRGR
jgi:MFS family permease